METSSGPKDITMTMTEINAYLALKYSSYQRVMSAVNDTNGNPLYITDEIIIHFDPDSLIRDKIDRREIKFGELGEFISPAFISEMGNKLDLSGQLANAVTLKVYQDLIPDDSICISWRGDTLKVPPFWASLVVKIPVSNQKSSTLAACRRGL